MHERGDMATIKCDGCGANIIREGDDQSPIISCEFCGTANDTPKADNAKTETPTKQIVIKLETPEKQRDEEIEQLVQEAKAVIAENEKRRKWRIVRENIFLPLTLLAVAIGATILILWLL